MGISQRKMLVEWDIYGYLIGISYRDIMRYKGTYMCQRCKFPELHGAFDVSSKPCLKKKTDPAKRDPAKRDSTGAKTTGDFSLRLF